MQQTYFSQTTVAPAPPVVVQTVTTTNRTDGCREAIPALPMALAILICILNFLFPGLGTIIGGFCVLCIGNVGQSGGGRFGTFCINFWVGWLQMALALCFIGWVWSIIWGYAFIASAAGDEQTTTVTTVTQPVPVAATVTTVTQPSYIQTAIPQPTQFLAH